MLLLLSSLNKASLSAARVDVELLVRQQRLEVHFDRKCMFLGRSVPPNAIQGTQLDLGCERVKNRTRSLGRPVLVKASKIEVLLVGT